MKKKHWVLGTIGGIALVGVWFFMKSGELLQKNKDEGAYAGAFEEEIAEPVLLTSDEMEAMLEGSGPSDRAEEMLAEGSSGSTIDLYQMNNRLFADSMAPCNQGGEPLYAFVRRFISDDSFQKSRIQLLDETVSVPHISANDLQVLDPDSTGYFAGWQEIEADCAAFCSGWLDAEAEQMFIFERSSDGLWHLVDYFGSI